MDDASANVAAMQAVVDPGEVGTESLATHLLGEIQRMRSIIKEMTGEDEWYVSPSNSLQGIVGATRNILRFGDFEQKSSATGTAAPDGWDLEGTPSAISVNASDAAQAGVNKVQITADAASEGIKQTLEPVVLKASTVYSVWGEYKVNAGDSASVLTTGASSNLSQTALDATSFTAVTGNFTTDSTPTDVVLKLLADDATDVVHFGNFAVMEGNFNPGRFVPNYGLVGGIYAWAKGTNSGTPTMTLGQGFTNTVGDLGTGHIQLNFARTLPDTNYLVIPGGLVGAANGTDHTCKVVSQSTTQIVIQTTAGNSQSDMGWGLVVIR